MTGKILAKIWTNLRCNFQTILNGKCIIPKKPGYLSFKILAQLPLPKHLDGKLVINTILPFFLILPIRLFVHLP